MRDGSSQDPRRLVKTGTPGVYRRGGRYVVVARDNRGRQVKRFARTLAEARDVKAALRADVSRGEYRATSKVTFAAYVSEWVETYAGRTRRGLREATRADYKATLMRDAVPFFGRMRLAEIEPRDVKRYAAHVAARGVSANTVRLALAPLKACLATAVEDGLIRSNPAAGVRIADTTAEPEAARPKALTEDELRALLAQLSDEWRLFFTLLAQTGLRIAEAVALRWQDVDFGRRRLLVRRRYYRGSYAAPKSRYGARDVPLSRALAQALWEARKRAGGDAGALAFPGRGGEPLVAGNLLRRVLKPAAGRAGVPWAGFHTLRHTAATLLFTRGGWNAKQVQVALGHHSPAFTLATYVHLLPDDLPDVEFFDAPASGGDARPASSPDGEVGFGRVQAWTP